MQGYPWTQTSNQTSIPRYLERPPPAYREQFPPSYHAVRDEQNSYFQTQSNHPTSQHQQAYGQQYVTMQPRYSNEWGATNQWGQPTNQNQPQYQHTAYKEPQQYHLENSNRNNHNGQSSVKQNASYSQSNRMNMSWNYNLQNGNSGINRGRWTHEVSNKVRHTPVNNHQQSQSSRTGSRRSQKHQITIQQQRCMWYHRRQDQSTWNRSRNPSFTSCNSVTVNSEACTSASNNSNQAPINQKQRDFQSNPVCVESAPPCQMNLTTVHQMQDPTSEVLTVPKVTLDKVTKSKHNFENSIVYNLLVFDSQKQGVVGENKRTYSATNEPNSAPSAPCTVDLPSKRRKQTKPQNNTTIVSKNKADNGVQSPIPESNKTETSENNVHNTSRLDLPYTKQSGVCSIVMESHQHAKKVVGVVLPISQQISSKEETMDIDFKNTGCPLFAIDSVWSLSEKDASELLFPEFPAAPPQQDDRCVEKEIEGNSKEIDESLVIPAAISTEPSFDLSSVPVAKYTLKDLEWMKSKVEKEELAAGYPEQSDSLSQKFLDMFWNGNKKNVDEDLTSFLKDFLQSFKTIVRDSESVVFESIETETLNCLPHCEILKNETYSTSTEFKSSWLNVDGQPADIEKVLAESQLNGASECCMTSQLGDNAGIISLNVNFNTGNNLTPISGSGKSANSDVCSRLCVGNGNIDGFSGNPKMQDDTNQSPIYITKPSDGNSKPLTEQPTNSEDEVPKQAHSDKTCPNELLLWSPKSNCSDDMNIRISEMSGEDPPEILTEPLLEQPTDSESEVQKQDHCDKPYPNELLIWSPDSNVSDDMDIRISEITCGDLPDVITEPLIEQPTDSESEVQKEDHYDKTCPNELLLWSPENNASDDMDFRITEISEGDHLNAFDACAIRSVSEQEFPTNTTTVSQTEKVTENVTDNKGQNNFFDTFQFEDITDDEIIGNEQDSMSTSGTKGEGEVSSETKETTLIKEIADDTVGNIEVVPQTSVSGVTTLLEDVSDCENSRNKEVAPHGSEVFPTEDIFDDDIIEIKEIRAETHYTCVIDISSDENSSDESSMAATVLSSEDAIRLFLQVKDEPKSGLRSTSPPISDTSKTQVGFDALSNLNKKEDNCLSFFSLKDTTISNSVAAPKTCTTAVPNLDCSDDATVFCERATRDNKGQMLKPQMQGKCYKLKLTSSSAYCTQEVNNLDTVSSDKSIANEKKMEQRRDLVALLEQQHNVFTTATHHLLESNSVKLPKIDFLEQLKLKQYNERETHQKSENLVKSISKPAPTLQKFHLEKLTKVKKSKRKIKEKFRFTTSEPLEKHNEPWSKKLTFSEQRQKTSSICTLSGDSELFAPDAIVKRVYTQNKNRQNVPVNKSPSCPSQKGNNSRQMPVGKVKSSRNDQIKTLEDTDDISCRLHASTSKSEQCSAVPVNKTKTNTPKKVRFNLYGLKEQDQVKDLHGCSVPASLTISDQSKDYTGRVSAKQKVHNLWSSTFIPKSKKKTMKPQDLLKSNMSALRTQLIHREISALSSVGETSNAKRSSFRQKLTRPL